MLFLLILLLNFFAPIALAQNASPSIGISEIGAYETAAQEWIEIYNSGTEAVDLMGWKFFEDGTNHALSLSRGTGVLSSGEFAIIANNSDAFILAHGEFSGTIFDSSWGTLKKEGEEIGLKNSSGELIELFTYPPTSETTSLERIDLQRSGTDASNWISHPSSHSIGALHSLPEPQPVETEPAMSNPVGTTSSPLEAAQPEAQSPPPTLNAEPTPLPQPPSAALPPPSPNLPPQAAIRVQSGVLSTRGSTTINFDGRSSYDPNNDPLTFVWDMGDGTSAATANPGPHKYDRPGTYTVRLTVIDNNSLSSTASETVTILDEVKPAPKAQTPLPSAPSVATSAPQNPPAVQQTKALLALPDKPLEVIAYIVLGEKEASALVAMTGGAKKNRKQSALNGIKKTRTKSKKQKAPQKNGDLSKNIRITEIFPRPEKEGEAEWIELTNAGSTTVNLGNWMLSDAARTDSPYVLSDSIALKPGQHRIFSHEETRIALNNGADAVYLADFNGDVIDLKEYEHAEKGKAYARFTVRGDNSEFWEWAAPTPGKQNPAVEEIEGVIDGMILDEMETPRGIDVVDESGTVRRINLSDEAIDPLVAQTVFKPGVEVALAAENESDGTYTLHKVNDIRSRKEKEGSSGGISPWLFAIVFTLALNGAAGYFFYKKFRA